MDGRFASSWLMRLLAHGFIIRPAKRYCASYGLPRCGSWLIRLLAHFGFYLTQSRRELLMQYPTQVAVVLLRGRWVACGWWEMVWAEAGEVLWLPRWRAVRLVLEHDGWLVQQPISFSFLRQEHPMDITTLLTPPSVEPISLAETKLYLRIDDADEDALVQSLIRAARETIEQAVGRSLLPQQWRWTSGCVVETLTLQLPRGPISAIDSVQALNSVGTTTLVANTDYQLLAGDRLLIKRMPSHATLQVNFTAGYASATLVPAPLKQAVLMLCAHLYDAREVSLAQLPASVAGMIAPFRQIRL